MSALIRHGAKVNAVTGAANLQPLHVAAQHAGARAVAVLLAAGAGADDVDMNSWTPLHYAARFLQSGGL